MHMINFRKYSQSGFTLIELMVGLVIGLIGTLVIMQTLSVFEGQKRTTVGTANAQVNGSIALYNIQRLVQVAGYGLPIFDATKDNNHSPLNCSPTMIDHDLDALSAKVEFFPIAITDGGAGSDKITARYFPGASGAIPVDLTSVPGPGDILPLPDRGKNFVVTNNLGCKEKDLVLVVDGTACNIGRVVSTDDELAGDTTIMHVNGPDVDTGAIETNGPGFARLSCIGAGINAVEFSIVNNQLANNDKPVIADIVDMQAQYGITATPKSNKIIAWVDATGPNWTAPTNNFRNRIRAVRVAVIARNGLLEKTAVTRQCSSTEIANPTGLCAWDATSANPTTASPAPAIDLNAIGGPNYRYRVYETIIPLRNLTWSGEWLS